MVPLSDATMRAVELAMRGLATRADMQAHNLANINTPNFRAKRVDFETALRAALNGGRIDRATSTAQVLPADGLPDGQGNTVDIETEVVGMMKDNLMRQAMANAYNFKVGVLRTAINGVPR